MCGSFEMVVVCVYVSVVVEYKNRTCTETVPNVCLFLCDNISVHGKWLYNVESV